MQGVKELSGTETVRACVFWDFREGQPEVSPLPQHYSQQGSDGRLGAQTSVSL